MKTRSNFIVRRLPPLPPPAKMPPLPPPPMLLPPPAWHALVIALLFASSVLALADSVPFAWGSNFEGQLGDGTTTIRSTAVAVVTSGALSGKSVSTCAASAMAAHCLAVTSDGKVYGWGENAAGQLGNGSTAASVSSPVAVDMSGALLGKTVVAAAAGFQHSLVLTSDNLLYAWGSNAHGELGDGTTTDRTSPVAVDMSGVLSGKTIVKIAAGQSFSIVVDSNGIAYGWGENSGGQLGDGSTTARHTAVAVDASGVLSGKMVTGVSAGSSHCLVFTSDGMVFSWGSNSAGTLGDGTSSTRTSPVAVDATGVLSGKVIVSVGAGWNHSVAAASDGTVYAWGWDGYGQLGNDTITSTVVYSPVAVDMSGVLSGKVVTQVGAGLVSSLVLTADGELYAWGRNLYGDVGDGTTTTRTLPVAVDMSGALASYGVSSIFSGFDFNGVVAAPAVSTITPANRFTYAANFGWLNWRTNPLAVDAPVIETTMLHGRVYSANVGWIDLGDGTPSTSAGYAQTGGDIGVNHDGAGGLSGYAYGANIGWIYFDPTIAAPPRVDLITGALSGYAYSANCGWINLAGVKTRLHPGADLDVLAGGGSGDGIPDAWEIERASAAGYGSSLSLLGGNANSDFDGDGISDRDEYLADTNPFSAGSRFRVTGFQYNPQTGSIDLNWNGSTRRAYKVYCSSDLRSWTQVGTTQTGSSAALTLGGQSAGHLFFRMEADVPLAE